MRPLQPTVRQLTAPTPSPSRRPRRRKARRLALLGALIGATSLAACGGGDDATPAPASAATATPPPAAAPAKTSRSTEAKIADFAFSPANIEVKVGDKITWTNDDADAHTVTATSGAEFDSGTLAQGADFTFEAKKPGTIAYFCAIHPSMKGTITVH